MRNKRFAVTGGIGSGKSAVCEVLKKCGFAVFSCDAISRTLWEREDYRRELGSLFPACAEDGLADRKKIAALVFSDGSARRTLENFSHPRIMKELLTRMEREPVSFAEVPLLFEGGYRPLFDGVILVLREERARVDAVKNRDGLTVEEVRARIAAQVPQRERTEEGIFAIDNNGTPAELEQGVSDALRFFGLVD